MDSSELPGKFGGSCSSGTVLWPAAIALIEHLDAEVIGALSTGISSWRWLNLLDTVDGRNSAPVEIGSLSHYLQGFIHPRWCRISSIRMWAVITDRNFKSINFWIFMMCSLIIMLDHAFGFDNIIIAPGSACFFCAVIVLSWLET